MASSYGGAVEPVEVEVKNKASMSRRWVGVENVGRIQNATPTPTGSTEIRILDSGDTTENPEVSKLRSSEGGQSSGGFDLHSIELQPRTFFF